jgi:hypothetical protein
MSEARLLIHPYAEILPPMPFPAFGALYGDIARHGLQEDIVPHEIKEKQCQHAPPFGLRQRRFGFRETRIDLRQRPFGLRGAAS